MIKNVIAKYESLAGFVIGLDCTDLLPEQYLTNANRYNTFQPDPIAESVVFFHVGTIDDEKMDMETFPAPRRIGDLSASVKLLKEEAAKRKALQDAAQKGEQDA